MFTHWLLLHYWLETCAYFVISNDVGLTVAGSKHKLNPIGTRPLLFSQLVSLLKASQAIPQCAQHYDSVSVQTVHFDFYIVTDLQ